MRRLLLVAALLAVPMAGPSAAEARASCSGWRSVVSPPQHIRVYRVAERRVDRVSFRLYVARVTSSEWGNVHPQVRLAGAVAVKQYAWYHALRWRGGSYRGQCFDVRDTTTDQIYKAKPASTIPTAVWAAVGKTWTWRLYRAGTLPMTGYRTGSPRPCASDGGYRLYAKSATRCAVRGWSAGQILRVYYSARLARG